MYTDTLAGAQLLHDGPPTRNVTIAVTRAIARTNPRLAPLDALHLGTVAVRAARANGLVPEFFAAVLLQESAFDPRAISSAGAIGIAQFMPETAAEYGVDPFDPVGAIGGSAALLASYVREYRGRYADPYAAALAAYNAGPGAVEAYGGIPPYSETRAYISDIYERWGGIVENEVLP